MEIYWAVAINDISSENILSSRVSLIHSWKLSRNQFLSNFSTCLIKHRLFLSSLFVALFLPKVNGHIVLFLFERHIFTFKTLNTDKCLRWLWKCGKISITIIFNLWYMVRWKRKMQYYICHLLINWNSVYLILDFNNQIGYYSIKHLIHYHP